MIGEIIFIIIGGIIGFASSYFMWKLQTRYERKNIAKALYIELSSLEDELKAFAGAFRNPPPGFNPDSLIKIDQPFCNTEGLFFSFKKEIASFNTELSNSLFEFYINLLRAEEFRKVDKSNILSKPLNDAMKTSIIKAYERVPHLKELLKKEFT